MDDKYLFDEWKYRHEMFYKLLYRYIWAMVVLAVLPLIPLPFQISAEFLHRVHQVSWPAFVYWGLVIVVVFGGTSLHLIFEFRYCQAARRRLEQTRKALPQEKLTWLEFREHASWKMYLYMGSFIAFFCACIVLPGLTRQDSIVTRMANHEPFGVFFDPSFPPQCDLGGIAPSSAFRMSYDRKSIAWSATGPFPTPEKTQVWGAAEPQHRTPAEYRPEKHFLIIGGIGLWFDDDKQVFRSCGNNEYPVAKIIF